MRFYEMSWPALRQVRRDGVVVVVPIAACEQHGRHLPVFTDTLLVTAVAEAAEQRLPDKVLLLPTLWLGASHHHLPFGATLSLDASRHAELLAELLRSLLDDGYRRLLVLNGHGGNLDPLHVALRQLQPSYRHCLLVGAAYWELAADAFAELSEGPRKYMGHACEMETSMLLALRPDLVRLEEARDEEPPEEPALRGLFLAEDMAQRTQHGVIGYPQRATAEKGRRYLDAAVQRTVEVVEALLARPLPASGL
jgi:creatinine amidohydrolase